MTIGAELECSLVGPEMAPFAANQRILADVDDDRWTVELDRFNVEANLDPMAVTADALSRLAGQLNEVLTQLERAATVHEARIVTIGINPGATFTDLEADALTQTERYEQLDRGLRALRGEPFHIDIRGPDHLRVDYDHVTIEGANTSFQLHLRVPPARFGAVFDAAQLATAPTIALGGNSPLLMGHHLWEETRIPLFQQAVDDRPAGQQHRLPRVGFGPGWAVDGAHGLYSYMVERYEPILVENTDGSLDGHPPGLDELRLLSGTVWWWNRPVYDPSLGGHLRVELRALPSGPTVVDMTANAAYLLGLTLGLEPDVRDITSVLDFELFCADCYATAREGLAAPVHWVDDEGGVTIRPAHELALELLPVARRGLLGAGLDEDEVDRWLGIIEARIRTGQTGARWLGATFERLRSADHPDPGRAALGAYLEQSVTARPVHEWPPPA